MAARQSFIQQEKDFDFSALYQSMGDIRKSLWNLSRQDQNFKKKLSGSHGHYFNHLMTGKRAEQTDGRIFGQSADSRNQRLNSGIQQLVIQRDQKSQKEKVQTEENESRQKLNLFVREYVQQNDSQESDSDLKSKGLVIMNKLTENLGNMIQSRNDVDKKSSTQNHIQQLQKLKALQNQKQINELIEKFKKQVQQTFGQQSGVNGSPRTYTDPTKLNLANNEWLQLILKTDLHFMSYQCFKILLGNEEIMIPIARELQALHGYDKFTRQDLEDTIMQSDKDLFVQFRDKFISFDQLKARIAERQGLAKYTVYDDIKDTLHPSITQNLDKYDQTMKLLFKNKDKIEVSDLLRPLEAWEVNPKCLKSIQYVHKKKFKQSLNLNNQRIIVNQLRSLTEVPTNRKSEKDKNASVDATSRQMTKENLLNSAKDNQNIILVNKFQQQQQSQKTTKHYLKGEKLTGQRRLIKQYKDLHQQHQQLIKSSVAFYSSKNVEKQKHQSFIGATDYNFYQDLQNQRIDKDASQNQIYKSTNRDSVNQDQSQNNMGKERLAVIMREKEHKELQERRKSLLFLKQLELAGANIHVDNSKKKLLQMDDDLEIAIREDLMSVDDVSILVTDNKELSFHQEIEKRNKQYKQLKSSFAMAKNVKLQKFTTQDQTKQSQRQNKLKFANVSQSPIEDAQSTELYTPQSYDINASPYLTNPTVMKDLNYTRNSVYSNFNTSDEYSASRMEMMVSKLKHRVQQYQRSKSGQFTYRNQRIQGSVTEKIQNFAEYYGIPVSRQQNYNNQQVHNKTQRTLQQKIVQPMKRELEMSMNMEQLDTGIKTDSLIDTITNSRQNLFNGGSVRQSRNAGFTNTSMDIASKSRLKDTKGDYRTNAMVHRINKLNSLRTSQQSKRGADTASLKNDEPRPNSNVMINENIL
ncbi:UNKNOWN [Stylonychia lemnae]|uniref:Uncharacterized protein n=1 Tax=Stylonychia lemnae TaxID=5949 RepID=A0A078AKM1_STYLE|nr:UNKNOWN [Stylonychia lemnae]|eukprot:CDW81992.1 UNKNOWN [Stylonychia lemnae]